MPAPRFPGIDEHGREILSFIDGQVSWQTSERSSQGRSEAALVDSIRSDGLPVGAAVGGCNGDGAATALVMLVRAREPAGCRTDPGA